MQIIPRVALLGLLAVPAMLLGADKLQDALAGLKSKDVSTYEKAAEFLAKHPQDARDPLKKLLLQQDDKGKDAELVRFRAAKLLGDLNDQESAEVMKKVLSSGQETNAAVRVEMIRALAKLKRKDVIIAYSNSGVEKSGAVTAAIALALQGSTGEDSKAELGRLLSSTDDERVSRAAVFAISKIYMLENSENAAPGKPAKLMKAASSGAKPAPPPPPPNTASNEKKDPTAADKAIFAALKAKQESKNAAISKEAAALLEKLSKTYKQP